MENTRSTDVHRYSPLRSFAHPSGRSARARLAMHVTVPGILTWNDRPGATGSGCTCYTWTMSWSLRFILFGVDLPNKRA